MNIFQMAINNVNEGKERKRGRKKKLNVVLDSESVDIRINGVDMLRTAINWGIVIGDNYGNTLFERDFIISDIYNTPLRNVLNSYYIAKLQPIENDPTTEFVANFKEFYDGLRQMWLSLSVFWDLEFWSFNADFDCKAFLLNAEYFMNENFRDKEFEQWLLDNWFCIQNLAVHTILATDDFKMFVLKNMLMTDSANYPTNAEDTYRYIINNPEFEEDHTGLSDSRIEYEILLECKTHATSETPKQRVSGAWRTINPKTYKMGKKQYCVPTKGQIFWEKANDCLPEGATETTFIQRIEL